MDDKVRDKEVQEFIDKVHTILMGSHLVEIAPGVSMVAFPGNPVLKHSDEIMQYITRDADSIEHRELHAPVAKTKIPPPGVPRLA